MDKNKIIKCGIIFGAFLLLAILVVSFWGKNEEVAVNNDIPLNTTPKRTKANTDWQRRDTANKEVTDEEPVEDEDPRPVVTSLGGKVISSQNGGPIGGAIVSFRHEDQLLTAKSKADGTFYFLAHEEGLYELASASAEGYQSYKADKNHRSQAFNAKEGLDINDMVIELSPLNEVTGQVVTIEHNPLAGAKVCARVRGFESNENCVQSDDNGSFTISISTMVMLEASHPDYRSGVYFYHTKTDDPVIIVMGENIAGMELFTISGEVVGTDGQPIAGVMVMAQPEQGRSPKPPSPDQRDNQPRPRPTPPQTAMTDENGHFTITKLAEGTYTLVARMEGLESSSVRNVEVNREDVKITMDSGYVISGKVTDQETGAPIQSYTVIINRAGRGRGQTVAVMDADGRYKVSGLSKKGFEISIVAHGYAASDVRYLVPFNNEPLEENFELVGGGRVFGTIIDAESGEPIGGAVVGSEKQRYQMSGAGGYHGRSVSDPSGNFEFFGLPIGTRSLEVAAVGYNMKLVSGLDIAPGGSVGPLTIELVKRDPGQRPSREMTGIGAVLGKSKDGVRVMHLVKDSAAAEAGLKKGDIIIEVDGTKIGDTNFQDVVESIRGEEGSIVNFTVRHDDGSEEQLSVTRKNFKN